MCVGKGCNSPVIWAGGRHWTGTFERESAREDGEISGRKSSSSQRLQARRWLSDSKNKPSGQCRWNGVGTADVGQRGQGIGWHARRPVRPRSWRGERTLALLQRWQNSWEVYSWGALIWFILHVSIQTQHGEKGPDLKGLHMSRQDGLSHFPPQGLQGPRDLS